MTAPIDLRSETGRSRRESSLARARRKMRWTLLVVVVAGAFLLRVHEISRIFLWLDETDFFNDRLYGAHPQSLLDFARWTRDYTTNTVGWPAVIWMSCRLFGPTLGVARAGAAIAGTAAVALVFLLVYRLLPVTFGSRRFVPAILAATLTAISIPQIEFSQRTFPYGATTFGAMALIAAHLEVFRALAGGLFGQLRRLVALYTAAGVLAVTIHPSLAVLVAVSTAFLIAQGSREFLRRQSAGPGRLEVLKTALVAGPILGGAALLNAKSPKLGYRTYLPQYYHQVSFHSIPSLIHPIPQLAGHAYDLVTYHLNLFYNATLYWPEKMNWALLPLVLLCLSGWAFAGAGKFGAEARQLAQLGLAVTGSLAVLSTRALFPFGGVRQTLLLSPFLFAFAGLGGYLLSRHKATRILGGVAGVVYLAAWAFNLPRFYEERVSVYNADDIVRAWRQNGELPVYTRGSEWELEYVMRNHPEIEVRTLAPFPKPPYLLVATHWPPLENQTIYYGYAQSLKKDGLGATLVAAKPAFHLDSLVARTSLYFPPNSFWVYKITAR
jgi:hypothetical protein